MEIKNYEDAVKYLEGFIGKIRFEITPEFLKHHDPLERMRVLLSLLDNPQEKFKSVLVGGTSGKSSTTYLISHILKTAGYKTGLTISPHLQKINERIQINGQSVSDEQFLRMVSSIVDTIELMKDMEVGAPSYFEILIAMAFLYFVQQKVDIAVVEVGMGGEFDATNTLYPLAAVLTNVSLDHTNVLGGTVQKIARTKVGIIKGLSSCHPEFISGSSSSGDEMPKQVRHDKGKKPIVVTGVKQLSVIKIVEEKCKKVGAELYRLHKDFNFKIKKESLEGSVFDLTTTHDRVLKLNDLKLSLLGKHQVENASLGIETVLQLRKFGIRVSQGHIRKALKTAFFPGRFEVINVAGPAARSSKGAPSSLAKAANEDARLWTPPLASPAFSHTIVFDGAHNPTKMKAFLTSLKKLFPKQRKIFIVGFKFDKDIPKMLKQILRVADTLIVTQFHGKTDVSVNASMETKSIKYYVSSIKYKGKILYEENSKNAMNKAFEVAGKDDLIVVTGSLYLVGEVRNML